VPVANVISDALSALLFRSSSALFLFILSHPFLLFSSVAFRFDAPLFHRCRCGEEGDNESVEIAPDPPGIAVAPTALRSRAITFELVADPNAESPIGAT
jgi:hypothetical protein